MKIVSTAESCETKQRAIDATLFQWPSANPALLASQCRDCSSFTFPSIQSCAKCGGVDVEIQALPKRGRLWTWTVQTFMPKPPYQSDETLESFQPYGVGYVEFPGVIKVETRLLETSAEQLHIGDEMELIFYVHRVDEDGCEIINYAFRRVTEESQK